MVCLVHCCLFFQLWYINEIVLVFTLYLTNALCYQVNHQSYLISILILFSMLNFKRLLIVYIYLLYICTYIHSLETLCQVLFCLLTKIIIFSCKIFSPNKWMWKNLVIIIHVVQMYISNGVYIWNYWAHILIVSNSISIYSYFKRNSQLMIQKWFRIF